MAIATTQIIMKTGGPGGPLATELAVGEIALDTVNGELFTKDANNQVIRPNSLLYLDQTNPKLSTDLDANSNKITNLTTPLDDSDAATKAYVDTSLENFETGGIKPGTEYGQTLLWSTQEGEWIPNSNVIFTETEESFIAKSDKKRAVAIETTNDAARIGFVNSNSSSDSNWLTTIGTEGDDIVFTTNVSAKAEEQFRVKKNGSAEFKQSVTAKEFIGDGSKLTGIDGGAVDSVNGQTGVVNLSASDVGAEPAFSKNSGFNKNFGTTAGSVSEGNHTHNYSPSNHDHAGVYEPVINPKRSAFNKDFGTTSTTVAKGDHTHSQYLESFTETDPTVPSHVKSITTTEKANWNTAFGWGDHATAGYLTSFTESDPTVPAHVKAISQTDIDNWNNPPSGGGGKTYTGENGVNVDNTTDKISMSGSYTGTFTATVALNCDSHTGVRFYRPTQCGVAFSGSGSTGYMLPADGDGNSIDAGIELGRNDRRWSNGWFSGTVTAGGDVIAFSDARLKDNVETLDGSKVFEMRGVSFTKDGRESSGVIAQEIQKVAPELVHDDGEYLGVAYGNLVGYLIEAVKELKAEIEDLKNG